LSRKEKPSVRYLRWAALRIGEDPFDRRHLSPLRGEPFLQSLQVELEMPSDELAIRGQDVPELVGRHALAPKHGLRPGVGARSDLMVGVEAHADHDGLRS
jgi:hypothetical protein